MNFKVFETEENRITYVNEGCQEIMYYVVIIPVTLILCTIALKFIQVVRLLFRLGFK